MEQCIIFVLLTASLSGSTDVQQLQREIAIGDCSTLSNTNHKLYSYINTMDTTVPSKQINILMLLINRRMIDLGCKENEIMHKHHRHVRNIAQCLHSSQGDGWCDEVCNNQFSHWDGGDCCEDTCNATAQWRCGSGGYHCQYMPNHDLVPNWFIKGIHLCFNWNASHEPAQCGSPKLNSLPNHLCAGFGKMTLPYIDDTDNKRGGCYMSWTIESKTTIPHWFKDVQICFRAIADGEEIMQCGHGTPLQTCAPVGNYTQEYFDNTDSREGGCLMSWSLSIPDNAEPWAKSMAICMQWDPIADAGQCGGEIDRRLCAVAGSWTPNYRDDTDERKGGCKMQWGIRLV